MVTSAMALVRGRRQLLGLKEHFAVGSSDMVCMIFLKLFPMLRNLLVVYVAFCVYVILQFGKKHMTKTSLQSIAVFKNFYQLCHFLT